MVKERDRILIRVCEPTIGELEKECVLVKHAISVCSGGAALFLSLKVLAEETSCGEVIIPTFTMIATANVVREAGFGHAVR